MTMFSNLQSFLSTHICPKGKTPTHTRMPDKDLNIYGASYYIPAEDLDEFYDVYSRHIWTEGRKEYLTEKQLEKNGMMAVDLDFRYNYDVEKRLHTKEFVDTIVIEYLETMKEVMLFDKETQISVFVMEKPNVNRLLDGSMTKDGIHIAFGMKVDYDKQLYIRKRMIAKDLLGELPLLNDAESVYDEGISKGTTNWTLLGSRKPANEAYELKYHYEVSYDTNDGEFMISECDKPFNPLEHLKWLSVQCADYHEYETNPKWKGYAKPIKNRTPSSPKSITYVVSPSSSDNEKQADTMIEELVLNEIGTRFNNDGLTKKPKYEYYDKLKVASALKTLGEDYALFDKWCRLGANREVKDPMKTWDSVETWDDKDMALLCLENILRRHDKNKFRIWRLGNHNEKLVVNMTTGEENTKAKYIQHELFLELKRCCGKWYECDTNTGLWCIVESPHAKVANHLTRLIHDELEAYIRKVNDATGDEKKEYEKIINLLHIAKRDVNRASGCSSIMKFLETYLRDNKFIELLDINMYRMPYKNGILCLKTLNFEKGIKSNHYLTKTLDFEYQVPTREELDWVKLQLKKIYNWNDTHLEYAMSVYGYAFTGDAEREQNLWCKKGENASNGKSSVLTALCKIMPQFVKCFESQSFEKDYKDRHKVIAEMRGLKIGWVNELRKGKKQDEAFFKLIAEATPQQYKVMHGTTAEMKITFKVIVVGNHEIKIEADEGVKRRYRHMQLDSDFQDDNEDDFENKKFKKDKDFATLLTSTYRNALLYYIYTYSVAYHNERKLKPYPIEWDIMGKKIMNSNNDFLVWFDENFVVDVNGKVWKDTFSSLIDKKRVNDDDLKGLKKKFKYDSQKDGKTYKIFVDGKEVVKQEKGFWLGFRVRDNDEEEE